MQNMMKQWVLASRPDGLATPDNFRLEAVPIPEIEAGQVLLKTLYLGVAPAVLRYLTNDARFEKPLNIGDNIVGRGVGRVVASRNAEFKVGDVLHAKLGWREYAVIDSDPYYLPFKMNHTDLPLSYGISALGFTGFTALYGIRDLCRVGPGDQVLVSGAAGGVGSEVAFMARALGAKRVVGIAGGEKKCHLLVERLGYDDAIDYKRPDLWSRLDDCFPDGVDCFFDNVGGRLLDEVLGRIRRNGRIAICGRISEYLIPEDQYHRARNLHCIGKMDARMEGFFVFDLHEQFAEFETTIAQWLRSGQLHPLEDMLNGLEHMPEALIGLYAGTNSGMRVVRVASEDG